MGIKEMPGYDILCDECGRSGVEVISGGEYGSWGDVNELKDMLVKEFWQLVEWRWLCEDHAPPRTDEPLNDPTRLPAPLFGPDSYEYKRCPFCHFGMELSPLTPSIVLAAFGTHVSNERQRALSRR